MVAPVLDAGKAGNTRTLAEFLIGLEYDDIPAGVVEQAKIFTLEAVGHIVHARAQPVSQLVVGYARELAAAPQATILGAGLKTSVAQAAYVLGSLAHADELESYGTLPGTGLIPPIAAGLAAGEYQRSSGRDYIAALVAGVEMQGRLGMAGIGACDRGFMGISLVGPGAAAVTAGRLFGLDVDQLQFALGTALPLGNGSTRGCGSMAHVHEAGVPSQTGVFAAQLAAAGFTSCPDFLDGANSWGLQYAGDSGRRPYDEARLTDKLGDPLFFEMCGVAPKYYGSCGLTHQTIHGTIAVMRENGLAPGDIASIELIVPPWADRIAPFRDPVSGEQAKFSIRQGVAGLLVGGVPQLPYTHAFTDDAAQDPRYVAARERVTVSVIEGGSNVRGFADQTVVVALADGRTISKVVPTLEAVSYPLEERIAIFRNTVESLGSRADQLIDVVMNLEKHTVDEISALTD